MFRAVGNLCRLYGLAVRLRRFGALRALNHMDFLPEWLPSLARFVTFYIPRRADLPTDEGERLAEAFAAMGPTYIKLGQTLSTRPDLVADLADGLATLQDKLPAFEGDNAVSVIEEDLEGKLDEHFKSFDREAIAAASIAQVHKATLLDGTEVAVKVLRPGIRQRFKRDLDLFYWLADQAMMSAEGERLRPREVVSTIEDSIHHELDLRLEAAAAEELGHNMLHQKGYNVPRVYWQQTSERVLTTEWIEGVKLNKREDLKAAGHNLEKLAETIIEAFLSQAMNHGFFHADLHPGNLIVKENGDIVAIDFGIMGRLTKKERRYMAEILYGFHRRDYMRVAQLHFDAGYVPETEDVAEFAQALHAIGEPIFDKPIEEISAGKLLAQLFQTTARFSMQTQPQLLQLQRSMVMAEGLAIQLFPSGNMLSLSQDVLEKWVTNNLSPEVQLADMLKALPSFVERLPTLLDKFMDEGEKAPAPPPVRPKQGVVGKYAPGLMVAAIAVAIIYSVQSIG